MADCIRRGQLDPIPKTVVLHSIPLTLHTFSPFTSVSWQEGYLHHCPEPKVSLKKITSEFFFYEENPNCKLIALLKKIIKLFFVQS